MAKFTKPVAIPPPVLSTDAAQRAQVDTEQVARANAAQYLPAANNVKLKSFGDALAARNTSRVDVGVMGASTVEGYPNTSWANTIEQKMADRLVAQYPTGLANRGTGVIGVPSTFAAAAVTWPLVFTGGGYDDTTYTLGVKHRCWYAFVTGDKVQWTLDRTITSFEIAHILNTAGHATGGYYKIGAAAAVPFNTYAAAAANTVITVVGTVAAGTVIEIGNNVYGYYTFFSHVRGYTGDETKGIHAHNLGNSGYTINNWAQGGSGSLTMAAIAALNLDVLILGDLGVNDGNVAAGNRTSAQFQTDTTTYIAQLRTAGVTCPIVLSAIYDTSLVITFATPGWSNYVTAMKTIAAADATVGFVDQTLKMPQSSATSPLGWYFSDGAHLDAGGLGATQLADAFTAAISIIPNGHTHPNSDLPEIGLKADLTKTLNARTASYTLVLSDSGKWITMSVASANTLTVPPNSSVAFPIGTQIEGHQLGAGQTTITPGSGVTINGAAGLKTLDQYSVFGVTKIATDTWIAYGRLTP